MNQKQLEKSTVTELQVIAITFVIKFTFFGYNYNVIEQFWLKVLVKGIG